MKLKIIEKRLPFVLIISSLEKILIYIHLFFLNLLYEWKDEVGRGNK